MISLQCRCMCCHLTWDCVCREILWRARNLSCNVWNAIYIFLHFISNGIMSEIFLLSAPGHTGTSCSVCSVIHLINSDCVFQFSVKVFWCSLRIWQSNRQHLHIFLIFEWICKVVHSGTWLPTTVQLPQPGTRYLCTLHCWLFALFYVIVIIFQRN